MWECYSSNDKMRVPDGKSLAERLRERIRQGGAITFRDWMESALYDPDEGYYRRGIRQRWGREGDYRTSPERSPLFAATFARYFAGLYETLNRPSRWTMVETGAGAGHFAEGVLTTLQFQFPEVFAATTYLIDEVSESSNLIAKERLARFAGRVEFLAPAGMPKIEAGLVFSNELLDAFPVHRVTVRDGQLMEFYVNVDTGGDFEWTVGPPSTPRIAEYLDLVGAQISAGRIMELNLAVDEWLTGIASRLICGYVVTVDYGADAAELYGTSGREQGTLRSFRRHQLVADFLAHPGDQDLTTTIDWTFVQKLGERLGLETIELTRQDHFLLKAGLLEELAAITARAEGEAERLRLRTSSREMILPEGMASRFQVLVQQKVRQAAFTDFSSLFRTVET